ncbi:MAG: hypothetical protein CM1200mP41_06570 [Gammaproteobacteria bacterium]|nr:MAG: hypothetical protein CM1200mP41_06570 [Gammaproteobacteria bacterium]
MESSHKTRIMVTRRWTEAVYTELAERYDARLNQEDRELSAEDIVAGCQGVQVLCPTTMDAIDAALIARLPDSCAPNRRVWGRDRAYRCGCSAKTTDTG